LCGIKKKLEVAGINKNKLKRKEKKRKENKIK